jgi:hypothetical protein
MIDLKLASREIRKIAAVEGIKTGKVSFLNHDRIVDALADDAIVAIIENSRKRIEVTAGDIRYASFYLV